MIEVEMSDDIRKYDSNFIGPFTKRQCISLLAGLLIGIPTAVFLPLSMDNKVMVGLIIIAAPVILCGIKMDGMPFEIFIIRYLYQNVLTPKKRKYKSQNTYKSYYKKIKATEENASPQSKKKAKKINYSEKKQFQIYQ